jgi:hypothetical protein
VVHEYSVVHGGVRSGTQAHSLVVVDHAVGARVVDDEGVEGLGQGLGVVPAPYREVYKAAARVVEEQELLIGAMIANAC